MFFFSCFSVCVCVDLWIFVDPWWILSLIPSIRHGFPCLRLLAGAFYLGRLFGELSARSRESTVHWWLWGAESTQCEFGALDSEIIGAVITKNHPTNWNKLHWKIDFNALWIACKAHSQMWWFDSSVQPKQTWLYLIYIYLYYPIPNHLHLTHHKNTKQLSRFRRQNSGHEFFDLAVLCDVRFVIAQAAKGIVALGAFAELLKLDGQAENAQDQVWRPNYSKCSLAFLQTATVNKTNLQFV